MGFSDFSRRPYQFKSMSLGSNEEFVSFYNDATERKSISFGTFVYPSCLGHFQGYLRDVDRLMERAERDAIFSEVVAGIVVQFKQIILPVGTNFHGWGEEIHCGEYLCKVEVVDRAELLVRNQNFLLQDLLAIFVESLSSGLESAHKVVVSALALLSFVYQYLIGCVDKGGSKTYSPGSFLFRLIFVAIVLFLGSFVWIKSRQVSCTANRRKRKVESDVPEGVYCRAVKNTRGTVTHYKYEPRFKPGREKLESGTSLEFNYLPLGSYDTPHEAEIVHHIAAVLYGKEEGRPVQFEGGLCLPFPSVTEPEKCPPSGKEKAVWVTDKTKKLYKELLDEKKRREKIFHPGLETGSYDRHRDGESSRSDPSPSAPGAPSTAVELTSFTPPQGGNGVEERATTFEPHGLGQERALAREEFPAFFSGSDLDEIFRSMPQLEESDPPELDGLDAVVGDNSETDNGFDFESTLVLPQSSALDNPTTAIFASLPQLGVGDQGLEIIEPRLNSTTAITFQQLESLPEQVQLQHRVTRQEQRPEEFSGSNDELHQKLLECERRISKLEVENEKWRSMFHLVAKMMSASDLDGYPVDLQ